MVFLRSTTRGWGCRKMKRWIVGWAVVVLLVGVGQAAGSILYTLTDLGTLGGKQSAALGINSFGQVVGYSYTSDDKTHAFLHDGATMHDLGTLDPNYISIAEGINDSQQVVGWSRNSAGNHRGFVWTSATEMQDLGTLGGSTSRAYAIDNSGRIGGQSHDSNGDSHAFLYDGTMHDLGTLGDSNSFARGINDLGQVTGDFYTNAGDKHVFLYDGTTMHDLGSFGGPYASGRDVNDYGQVVGAGSIDVPSGDYHAFLYDGTTMHDLHILGGFTGKDSYANAINNRGQVVGVATFGPGEPYRAFLYDGTMWDLNDLVVNPDGWRVYGAWDINENGQIAVVIENETEAHAALLTPIPEPSTSPEPSTFIIWSLLGALGITVGWWRRRRAA